MMSCSSLDVAETFEKCHRGVLRDIRNLDCSEKFNQLNFEPITYTDNRGREQPYYLITRDGFTFLVMGYHSEKAAQFNNSLQSMNLTLKSLGFWHLKSRN